MLAKDSDEPGASDSIAVGGEVNATSKQASKKQSNSAQKRRQEQVTNDGKPPKKKKAEG